MNTMDPMNPMDPIDPVAPGPPLKQSFAWWSFARPALNRDGLTAEALLRAAAEIGYTGVEMLDEALWPLAEACGLRLVTIVGHASIEQGLNRREQHARIEGEILRNLERARRWNVANLIVFSGTRDGVDDQAGMEATAEGLGRVAPAAEEAGVTLLLELLNSRVDHPHYQCDHTAWGVAVCRAVNSPRVKLLYDIYHMQIMEGDIIRTIRAHHPFIGHYHTAGNPGRHELDDGQELHYGAIARAIRETGYAGYVGQEFVPRGDALTALREAFRVCGGG